jgi:hypothetical protein
MTFTRPKLGAKVYLSRGPSGHAETFERTTADRELEMYLGGKAKLHITVEGFIRKMRLEGDAEQWRDVIAYLAERAHLEDADLVPCNVAVAFWAQVCEARSAAKLEITKLVAHGN